MLRRLSACLVLSLSGIAISGCQTIQYAAVSPDLPPLPPRIVKCLEGHVKVPRGDWTASIINDVIVRYQERETKLEGCMANVVALYNELKKGLAAAPERKGLFR